MTREPVTAEEPAQGQEQAPPIKDARPTKVQLRIEELARQVGAELTSSTDEGWPRYLAHCPAHSDEAPSLTFFRTPKGRYKWKCFAGCESAAIEAAMLELLEHPTPPPAKQHAPRGPVVAMYQYPHRDGAPGYEILRHEPGRNGRKKDFSARRLDGAGGWIYDLDDVTPLLYNLPQLQGQDVVYCPAGEKDADMCIGWGLVATTNHGGEGGWLETHVEQLREAGCKELVVLADNDPAGEKCAELKARTCTAAGIRVKVIQFDVKDVTDWKNAGHTAEELAELVAAAPWWSEAGAERPRIIVTGEQLREYTGQALEALRSWNADKPTVFQQGDVLVRLLEAGTQKITDNILTHVLARAADWFKLTRDGEQPCTPPDDVVADIFATVAPGLPKLDAFRSVPYFAPGGKLIVTAGYNPETRIYLAPPAGLVVTVPDRPTYRGHVRPALGIFERMLCRFPFDGELDPKRTILTASYANTLGAYLTPLLRGFLSADAQTPMFAFDAPALPGAGKTLLAKLAVAISSGAQLDPQPLPADGEEMRKLILAEMLQGRPHVVFDNVKTRVENAALESILTSAAIRGRELGYTRTVSVPNLATWYVTGNNLRFGKEALARSVWILIDPRCEFAEDRRFEMELPTWAFEHRGELVSAALTLIRYWIQQGAQPGSAVMGRFEAWSRTVGGILEAAGVTAFLGNRDAFRRRSDEESNEWRAFFRVWLDTYKAGTVLTAGELARDAQEHMPGIMAKAVGPRGATTTLGMALVASNGRTALGHRLTRRDGHKGTGSRERTGWSLEPF